MMTKNSIFRYIKRFLFKHYATLNERAIALRIELAAYIQKKWTTVLMRYLKIIHLKTKWMKILGVDSWQYLALFHLHSESVRLKVFFEWKVLIIVTVTLKCSMCLLHELIQWKRMETKQIFMFMIWMWRMHEWIIIIATMATFTDEIMHEFWTKESWKSTHYFSSSLVSTKLNILTIVDRSAMLMKINFPRNKETLPFH